MTDNETQLSNESNAGYPESIAIKSPEGWEIVLNSNAHNADQLCNMAKWLREEVIFIPKKNGNEYVG